MTSVTPGAPQPSQPQRIDDEVLLSDLVRGARTTLDGAVESAGQVVVARATVSPGPAGLLVAPMSGQPCVWFRSMVYPAFHWLSGASSTRRTPLPPVAPSDIAYGGVVGDQTSTVPFVVTDGVAAVVVHPGLTDVDTHVMTVNTVSDRGDVHVEWILPPDAEVQVVGAVGRPDGETPVLHHPAGPALVSTKDEKWLGARARAAAGLDPVINEIRRRSVRIALVIGLCALVVCLLPVLVVLLA